MTSIMPGSVETERLLSSDDEPRVTFRTPQPRFTPRLSLAVLLCTIGSAFPFGYSIGVVNAPQKVIEEFINATHVERTGQPLSDAVISLVWSVTVSIWAVGGMIGGISSGLVADRCGRKGGLLVTSVLLIIGGVLMFCSRFAQSYELLIVGRFFAGLQNGVGMTLCPMYLSEISPLGLRGFIGTLSQVAVVIGISTSEILGLDAVLGGTGSWNYLLGIVTIPSVVMLVLFPLCPESPRYLYLNQHRKAKAMEALQWLQNGEVAAHEMRLIEEEKAASEGEKKVSVCDLFRSRSLRAPLFVSVIMHISQQLSGINAAMFYSTSIFMGAGLSVITAQYITLGVGAVMFTTSSISAFLVDRAGRRALHLTGLGGMFISAVVITIGLATKAQAEFMTYVSVVGVFTFIMMFAVGPGSIPWFIVAELFRQGPRGAAMSIALFSNWFANFLVGVTFPTMQRTLGPYSFIPFAILLVFFIVYLYFRLPETKNKSIEEITLIFEQEESRSLLAT